MTIQEFYTKAWEGGYENLPPPHLRFLTIPPYSPKTILEDEIGFAGMLLDPKAWQAIGKVEGWEKCRCLQPNHSEDWKGNMHRMIDALAEGKTIEEFLATL